MIIGRIEVNIVRDGTFSLDPGAAFGIVPKPIWSREYTLNGAGRVTLGVNTLVASDGEISALIDGGLGDVHNEKFRNIFEIKPNRDYLRDIEKFTRPEEVRLAVHSHLHFDHSGRTLQIENGKPLFRNAAIVAQRDEFTGYSHPNEITRGNYIHQGTYARRLQKIRVDGNRRINGWISVIRTGGHSPGHEAIVLASGGREIIYPGDLFPTSFYLRPNYITAIDSHPFQSLKMKKLILKRAIRKRSLLILNHDLLHPSVYVSGNPEKPSFEDGDL